MSGEAVSVYDLPAPLVGDDCDLAGASWIKFKFREILRSPFFAGASHEVRSISLDLWAHACEQVPAGSLPDDDRLLAFWGGLGRCSYGLRRWRKVKESVMAAWTLCTDGRWYHPTLCEATAEASDSLRKAGDKRDADRQRLAEKRGTDTGQSEPRPRKTRPPRAVVPELPLEPRPADEASDSVKVEKCRGDVAATSSSLRKEIQTLSPPGPQGGGAGDSQRGLPQDAQSKFDDLEKVWPGQDATDSSEAAARAFRRLSAAERRLAIEGAKPYLEACAKQGRKICNRATYLRDKRWQGVVAAASPGVAKNGFSIVDGCPVLGGKFFLVEGSRQAVEWLWYQRRYLGRGLYMLEQPGPDGKRVRATIKDAQWPPVRMTEAPELLMPISQAYRPLILRRDEKNEEKVRMSSG